MLPPRVEKGLQRVLLGWLWGVDVGRRGGLGGGGGERCQRSLVGMKKMEQT